MTDTMTVFFVRGGTVGNATFRTGAMHVLPLDMAREAMERGLAVDDEEKAEALQHGFNEAAWRYRQTLERRARLAQVEADRIAAAQEGRESNAERRARLAIGPEPVRPAESNVERRARLLEVERRKLEATRNGSD